jgi:hypothetical protein
VALAGGFVLAVIPLLFVVRFFLTIFSYATGAAGGIFAPLLAIGALLGLALGQIFHGIAPAMVPEAAVFAVMGMAAYFTAIVRAPLMGMWGLNQLLQPVKCIGRGFKKEIGFRRTQCLGRLDNFHCNAMLSVKHGKNLLIFIIIPNI